MVIRNRIIFNDYATMLLEVYIPFCNQVIGKKSISDLIVDKEVDIKFFAKNTSVQKLWEKFGFVDNGITMWEIPMIYKVAKNKQEEEGARIYIHE